MRSAVKGIHLTGLNTDLPEFDLPSNFLTIADNVRVHDGKIGNINCGYDTWQTLLEKPLRIDPFRNAANEVYWVYGSADKLIVFDPATTTIGGPFTATTYWSATTLTGVPVWANETNKPWYWPSVDGVTAVAPLPWDTTDATDWDNAYGQQYRAEVIRSHKNFLFAINIREGAIKYPSLVHWSAPADPGSPPPTWKYRETDNRSGRIDIAETDGEAVDGLTLGDSFLVYKRDSVWRFTFVGGNAVFRKTRIQSLPGILSRDCVVEIPVSGGQHVVLSNEDLYVHNGQTFRSLITNRTRSRFLSLIDSDNFQNCFLQVNSTYKEVWVCVPRTGRSNPSGYANKAAVWSWEDDTWTERDLPDLTCAIEGPQVTPGRVLINDDVGTIGSDHTLINQVNITPRNTRLIAGTNAFTVLRYDTGVLNDGVAFPSRIQRQFLNIDDDSLFNTVNELYPTVEWLGGNSSIEFRVGGHETMQSSVVWDGWLPFDIKKDRHVHPRATGARHALEIRAEGVGFGLTGFVPIDYSPAGGR